MEVTSRFIQMCKNADEIQGRWYPEVGDCVTSINSDTFEGHLVRTRDNNFASQQIDRLNTVHMGPLCNRQLTRKYYVWLPRVDQLQECVALTPEQLVHTFQEYFQAIIRTSLVNKSEYRTIWLMFVMWQVHEKVWTGKHWQRVLSYNTKPDPEKRQAKLLQQVPVS